MNLQELFTLISCGLSEKRYELPLTDEKEITKILIENGLVGICYPSLNEHNFEDIKWYKILKKAFGAYLFKDLQQEGHLLGIRNAFNHHEINHIFLKGSRLKYLYPKTYMRAMGDIDLIVRKNDFNQAIYELKSLDYKLTNAITHHHTFIGVDDNEIELHQSLVSDFDDSHGFFLERIWEHAYQKQDHQYQMETEFEYMYLLLHLYRHLKQTGIGLRSLIDLAVFSQKNILDQNKLNTYLEQTKLHGFYQKVSHINQIILGQKAVNNEDQKIIEYIIKSGIHGKGSSYDYYLPRRVSAQEDRKVSKIRYFFGQVFPSRKHLQETYPYLKKYKILLPWAWFSRLIRFIFRNPRSIKARMNAIQSDRMVDETIEVFDYFTK